MVSNICVRSIFEVNQIFAYLGLLSYSFELLHCHIGVPRKRILSSWLLGDSRRPI